MTTPVQITFGTASPLDTFEYEMNLFELYLQDMEEFLSAEGGKAWDRVEAERSLHPEEEVIPEAELDWIDRNEELDAFTDILRRSFFISLYSFLEFKITEECRRRKREEIPLELSDIAGGGIDRAEIYFKKVLRVYFPSDTEEWKEIKKYKSLRNCLVHSGGRLDRPRDQKELRKYVESKDTIEIKGNTIRFGNDFCVEACETIKTFLLSALFSNREVQNKET